MQLCEDIDEARRRLRQIGSDGPRIDAGGAVQETAAHRVKLVDRQHAHALVEVGGGGRLCSSIRTV